MARFYRRPRYTSMSYSTARRYATGKRKRVYTRRGTGFRYRATRGINKNGTSIWGQGRAVTTPELKERAFALANIDVGNTSAVTDTPTDGIIYLLNGLSTGYSAQSRIGNSILAKYLTVNATVAWTPMHVTRVHDRKALRLRVQVVYDFNPNGNSLEYDSGDWNWQPGTVDTLRQFGPTIGNKYRILFDKTYSMGKHLQTTIEGLTYTYPIKIRINLANKNLPVRYLGIDPDMASIETGAIRMFAWCDQDQSGTAGTDFTYPNMAGQCRFYYTDP